MTSPLEGLARRAEADPFFLACTLLWYARSENLTEQQLADRLGCTPETLVKVRLCGTPGTEKAVFERDVKMIAAKFGLDEAALKKAVRRGQVVFQMQAASPTVVAARDRRPEDKK